MQEIYFEGHNSLAICLQTIKSMNISLFFSAPATAALIKGNPVVWFLIIVAGYLTVDKTN